MGRGSSSTKTRAALMMELEHAIRRSTGSGAIFSQTVASYVGVSSSDLECLDFLNLEGRVTAGRLAELTGLTTGAITGVIDRLEKAGFVRRERDDEDRRKVFIAPVPENIAKVGKCYEPVQRAMLELWSAYSETELRLLLRFADEGYKAMLAATEQLKTRIEGQKDKRASIKKSVKTSR
jgi:DNA-binding MarR family transcriptional regulator